MDDPGFEACLDGCLLKLNMFVKSLPNWRALERLREPDAGTPSPPLTLETPVVKTVESPPFCYEESIV